MWNHWTYEHAAYVLLQTDRFGGGVERGPRLVATRDAKIFRRRTGPRPQAGFKLDPIHQQKIIYLGKWLLDSKLAALVLG